MSKTGLFTIASKHQAIALRFYLSYRKWHNQNTPRKLLTIAAAFLAVCVGAFGVKANAGAVAQNDCCSDTAQCCYDGSSCCK